MRTRTIPAVGADEFKFAVGVSMSAVGMRGPYRNPSEYGVDLGDGERLVFTDTPMARGGLAVAEQFSDHDKYHAIMMRISEMMQLTEDDRMRPYMRGDGNDAGLREEVLDVAAALPMNAKRGFDRNAFFRELKARVDGR